MVRRLADAPSALVVVSTISARASAGKHVVMADSYAAFSKDASHQTALKADGLHPNSAGYVILGDRFYGVIGALLR